VCALRGCILLMLLFEPIKSTLYRKIEEEEEEEGEER
jgi:hypothetical protein